MMTCSDKAYCAAIFDLDGLVLDTETMSHSAWKRAVADFGFDLADDLYQKIIGLSIMDIEKVFSDAFGENFPLQQITECRCQYMKEHINEHGVDIKPGLIELLDFLDEIKLPKAVATSSIRELAILKLTATNLIDRFDVLVCGDQIKNGKPAPDIFLKAAEMLEAPPQKCLAFEDSNNGLLAADNAGMTTIVVPDFVKPSGKTVNLARKVFSSIDQAIPFIKELLGISE
ncbi:MAG: HAD family phosphatase [Planctomycetes bacterium]|nr:HAD family phosphatase [Planctomycetota bacterium]